MFKFRTANGKVLVGELTSTHPINDNYGYFTLADGRMESGIILWEETKKLDAIAHE